MGPRPWARYALAVAVTAVAIALRLALVPVLGDRGPYATVFSTVLLMAWYGGLGPSLVLLVLGGLGVKFFLVPPLHSFALAGNGDLITLVLFLITGSLAVALGHASHEGRRRAEEAADLARRRQELVEAEAAERDEAQRALRDKEAQLEKVTEHTSVVLTQCDRELRYVFVNRACAEFFGRPREEIVGRPVQAVLGDAAFAAIRPHVDKVLQGEVVEFETELDYSHAGKRFVHVKYVPDREPGGEVRGWFASVTDITDRKRAEEALREADRRKDEFLATLGHELRSPLAPIGNAVEMLRARGSADPELSAARDMIHRQVRLMTRLIDDLLDVSRITLGKLQLRTERVELRDVIEDAVATIQHYAESRGHQITVSLPAEPIVLVADPARLAQVFGNLLSNACKFTEKHGRIELRARVLRGPDASPEVEVAVVDDGMGIPPEFVPRLFEKFAQVSPALERSQAGLGLGLALVRGLAEMHGGSVNARNGRAGLGSEFVVRLPLPPGPPALTPRSDAVDHEPGPGPGHRILVVDDNRDSADSLAMLLRLSGNEVETAHGGREAVATAARYRPELVLMDIGMPELNGYEACRLIREQPWGKQMVLIAQTGWGQDGDRRRAREAGFDGHLVKPLDQGALSRLLRSIPRSSSRI
jgi:PAS domain S-box-containing protein